MPAHPPTRALLHAGTSSPAAATRVSMLVMALLVAFTTMAGTPAEYPEHQVKAAWMFNFTRFVDWPATAFPSKDSPCVVGVLGKDPFRGELESAFTGKFLNGRKFELRRLKRDDDAAKCHILFIPAGERRAWRELQPALAKAPVLTIGEADGFLDLGAIVNFMIQDGSIAFEIDLRNAQKAGLKFDANVLKIAAKVKGKYE